jgi:DNA-binding NarL/FixJ family response regulator
MPDPVARPRTLRTLVAAARVTDRERIIRILDRAGGYDVLAETGDGRSAVRLSGQVDPELVLLDLDLPLVDGIDATPAILHNAPAAVIVILTPEGSDSGGVVAVRFGARAHVPLASSAEVLLAALAAALPDPVGRESQPSGAGTAPPSWWEALLADR